MRFRQVREAIFPGEGGGPTQAHRQPIVVLPVVPGQTELVVVVPDRGGVGELGVDDGGREVEGVERVADHGEVVETGEQLTFRPGPLREPGAHVVEGHSPVGAGKEGIRTGHASHAGQGEVSGAQLERRVEPVPGVAGGVRRQGGAGDEDQDVEIQPRVEDETLEIEHVPGQLDVVAFLNLVFPSQVVDPGIVDALSVGVLELGDVFQLEPERIGVGIRSRYQDEAVVVVGHLPLLGIRRRRCLLLSSGRPGDQETARDRRTDATAVHQCVSTD
jgi:hypothetical protein